VGQNDVQPNTDNANYNTRANRGSSKTSTRVVRKPGLVTKMTAQTLWKCLCAGMHPARRQRRSQPSSTQAAAISVNINFCDTSGERNQWVNMMLRRTQTTLIITKDKCK